MGPSILKITYIGYNILKILHMGHNILKLICMGYGILKIIYMGHKIVSCISLLRTLFMTLCVLGLRSYKQYLHRPIANQWVIYILYDIAKPLLLLAICDFLGSFTFSSLPLLSQQYNTLTPAQET